MAKKEEAPVKKTTTVTLQVGAAGISIIERGNGLPFISDRTDKAVEWLKAKGYKVTDVELIGEKPSNWDTVFEIAPADPVVPEEQPTLVDPITNPVDATAVVIEVVSTAPAN